MQRERSKYILVYESLLALIRQDDSSEERYLPSERDLGLQYGVDRLTVRKALDLLLQEGLIRKEPGKGTVILCKEKAPKIDLTARSIAFILPRGTRSVDRITEPFHSNLFYLIGKELKKRDCNLLYSTIESDGSLPAHLYASGVMGFIFVSQVPDKAIQEATAKSFPFILINRISTNFPMILEDRTDSARLALNHLYELGHKRIYFINGVEGYFTTNTSATSYMEFMRSHPDTEAKIFPSYWNFENGMSVMKEILSKPNKPTAVCACNATVALGAMEAAKKEGLKVPKDISFIGFDDIEQSLQASPTLTCVGVNIPLLARIAVDNLFSSLEQGNPGAVRTIVPVSLFVRESTGPAV